MIEIHEAEVIPGFAVWFNRLCTEEAWDSRDTRKVTTLYKFYVRPYERQLWPSLAEVEEVTLIYGRR